MIFPSAYLDAMFKRRSNEDFSAVVISHNLMEPVSGTYFLRPRPSGCAEVAKQILQIRAGWRHKCGLSSLRSIDDLLFIMKVRNLIRTFSTEINLVITCL